ncbi:MFS transporter [Escherichia coli]|nr:MFS transporter [Escherichia coli]EFS9590879.1 MFS transporter [Escherichia coli]
MRKIKGLRWYMIALVTLGTVLGYLTRNTVAAAAPTLMEELNISTQQYSYIIAAYSAAYTVMQPVAGYVLDVLGTKIGYAMFAVLWAVFCGATALAGSWGGLAIARGAVGAAEAAMIPAGLKASSEWFPAKERSIAVGYFNVGSSIGAMIAPPLFQRWFGVNLIVSRKMVVTLGAVLMIGPGMIGLFTNPYVAIMLLCIGGFAHQALSGALITLSSDVFGRNEVATANGLTGMSAWLASTLFALVVGALADTIGFSPLFAVLAVFDLLGALVIWTVLQNKPAIEVAQETHNDPAPQH